MNVIVLFKVSLKNRGEKSEALFRKSALQIPAVAREWIHFCNGYNAEVSYCLITGIIFCKK